jgi:hypothetical protein
MERRKALALAAAVTGTLGTASIALAAVGGFSVLGFGAAHHDARLNSLTSYQSGAAGAAGVVTRTKDVYDRITVEAERAAAATRSAGLVSAVAPALTEPANGPVSVTVPRAGTTKRHRRRTTNAAPRSTPREPAPTSTTEPARVSEPPEAPSPSPTTTTTQPAATTTTTTTMPPVTTTTRPRGVPADWPPGKPIPPMPPNCRQPQLEDNGVWNCDH